MQAKSIRMGATCGTHPVGVKAKHPIPAPHGAHGKTQTPQTTSSQSSQTNGNAGKPFVQCRSHAADAATLASGTAQPAVQPLGATRVPLRDVVEEAVSRWFNECHQDALRGDVKQQALLGQMYNEGYGCDKNPVAAQEWTDKSMARGYRMQGVYCEL